VIVYFLRHGIAEPQGASGDSARKLTSEGRAGLERLAKATKFWPDLILSSPYLRALETANLLNEKLGWGAPMVKAAALKPSSSPEALWDEIRVHPVASILVVSHEPLLSSTIAWVLGSTREVVDFQPGTLAALAIPPSNPPLGQLLWMIQPGMLL